MSLIGDRIFVPAGSIEVGSSPMILATVGVGSCVAVAIDDPIAAIGGLSHIFLPSSTPASEAAFPARYASTAVPLLVDRVLAAGAARSRIRARLAGGAVMFPELQMPGSVALGTRNASLARRLLMELEVPIDGEDIGGNHSRSITLHLASGRLVVRSARAAELVL